MLEYRAYVLGKNGRIMKRRDFEAADDKDALQHARQYVDGNDVEVWQLDRLVKLLTNKG